jgi:hypothetical protein
MHDNFACWIWDISVVCSSRTMYLTIAAHCLDLGALIWIHQTKLFQAYPYCCCLWRTRLCCQCELLVNILTWWHVGLVLSSNSSVVSCQI